jgi:hypothetical protein
MTLMTRDDDARRQATETARRTFLAGTTGLGLATLLGPPGAAESGSAHQATDRPRLAPTETVVVDAAAHDWNNAPWDQQKVVTYGDYQYVPYWDADHHLVLARRHIETGTVQTLAFEHTLSRPGDPHNNTAVGISAGDGRLHLSFDHHNQPLNYLRSRAGFLDSPPAELSTDQFGTVGGIDADAPQSSVTYPRFFTDSEGELYLCYRQGYASNGDSHLLRYDADAGQWTSVGRVFASEGTYGGCLGAFESRNAYLHDLVFDEDDRLHATWTYRESGGYNTNHDLHYAYSDDGGTTWHNNDGTQIADLEADDPIRVDDPGIVAVEVPQNYWFVNQGTMALDAAGQPHVFTHQSTNQTSDHASSDDPVAAANRHYVHYWRTPDGTWNRQFVDDTTVDIDDYVGLKRGDLVFDDEDNLHAYTVMDGTIFAATASRASDWTDWRIYRLVDGYGGGGGGWKLDERRWERDGVLSVPVTRPTDDGRQFVLQEFRLERGARPQEPTLSVTTDTCSGAPTTTLEVTEAVGAQRYTFYRRPTGSDDEWSVLAADVGADTFVHSTTDPDVTGDAVYEYRVAAEYDPAARRFSGPVATETDVDPLAADWEGETDGDLAGWDVEGDTLDASVSGGALHLTVTGPDPHLRSPVVCGPDGFAADYHDTVLVRMQNELDETTAQLFWNDGSGWTGAHSQLFDVSANDDTYHTYLIAVGDHPEWTGTIQQVRLDPLHQTTGGGTVHLDRFAVGPRSEFDVDPPSTTDFDAAVDWEWETDGDLSGWDIEEDTLSASVSGGALHLTVTGPDPHLHSPAIGLDADANGLLLVRMANELDETLAQVFWDDGGGWTGTHSQLFDVSANDDAYHTYLVAVGDHPEWTGTIQQLRFDPLVSTDGGGTVHVDRVAVGRRST